MVLNRVYRNLMPLLVVVLLTTFCGHAYSDASDDYTYYVDTRTTLNGVGDEIQGEIIILGQYESIRGGIISKLGETGSDSRSNVATSIKDAITGEAVDAVKTWIDQIGETVTGVGLVSALESINTQIEEYAYNNIDIGIFQRSGTGYNDTYNRYIAAYGALNDHYRKRANKAAFGIEDTQYRVESKLSAPDTTKIFVSACATPTGTCYAYNTDPNDHLFICKKKHGTSGATNVKWWICQSPLNCPRTSSHWKPCRGTNCNVLFPPPTREYYDNYKYRMKYHDHGTVCTEKVWSLFNGIFGYHATCGEEYFTCEGACKHKAKQNSGSGSGSMHACGVHATTVSGDHTWGTFTCGDDTHTGYLCQQPSGHGAASCGTSGHYACDGSDHSQTYCYATNSDGQGCTVGNYYACQSHSHVYPDPPSTDVLCSGCNELYDPDSSSAVNKHRVRSCRFEGCSNTWQACVTGWTAPICNKPWRKQNGKRCQKIE